MTPPNADRPPPRWRRWAPDAPHHPRPFPPRSARGPRRTRVRSPRSWRGRGPIARTNVRFAFEPSVFADASVHDLAEVADRDAVERTLGGDADAFASVVRRHAPGLLSICSRMVDDPRLGEELAQEAFARAYSNLGSFRGDCKFRHWLQRIAVNGCRDHLKAGARAERPSELSGDELVDPLDPERGASARQAVNALVEAIATLPEMYREAFTLFHVENIPYEEIEAITGVRVNALKVRVHRARLMLRARLGDLLEEETP